jgi:hypothetical protein
MGSDFKEVLLMFLVFGGGFWVLTPLVNALAKRIAAGGTRGTDPHELEELKGELQVTRQEVAELTERVDFTERLLAKQSAPQRLAPPDE